MCADGNIIANADRMVSKFFALGNMRYEQCMLTDERIVTDVYKGRVENDARTICIFPHSSAKGSIEQAHERHGDKATPNDRKEKKKVKEEIDIVRKLFTRVLLYLTFLYGYKKQKDTIEYT